MLFFILSSPGKIPLYSTLSVFNETLSENNSAANLYNQCCIPRGADTPKDNLTTTAMHKVFVRWCQDNEKGYKCSFVEFRRELSDLLNVSSDDLTVRTNKGTYFNFRLNHDAYDSYYYPYI